MKALLLLLLMLTNDPLREVEDLKLIIPSGQHEIFLDYSNDNFSQKLAFRDNSIFAEIKSSNFFDLNLNFRVFPNHNYMASLEPEVKEIVMELFGGEQSLKSFMTNVSFYLEDNIRYSDVGLPQDATSVIINRRANCVGFSNTVKLFLDSAGVRNQMVRGFYLKQGKKGLIPIPHRWVEIQLPNGVKFFYDPQYQRFSANYITTIKDIDFKTVRKFRINLIKKSRKLSN